MTVEKLQAWFGVPAGNVLVIDSGPGFRRAGFRYRSGIGIRKMNRVDRVKDKSLIDERVAKSIYNREGYNILYLRLLVVHNNTCK